MLKRKRRFDLFSWYNFKIEARVESIFQRGLFAKLRIRKGEIVAIFGGRICDHKEIHRIDPRHRYSLQVEDLFYLAWDPQKDSGDEIGFNHSCDPNIGFGGQITMVAMRDIPSGQEICFDYAMSDSCRVDMFISKCACNTQWCRETIRGTDWQRLELQRRYRGYFSPYLEKKIKMRKLIRHIL